MSSETINPDVVRKNRMTLILTVLAFALPALLAYLAHATGFWQSRGTINQGVLVTPPVDFDSLTITTGNGTEPTAFNREKQWWIAYLVPATCDAACRNSLLEMRQTQTATGPYQKRVSTLLIEHENSDPTAAKWAAENAPEMQTARVPQSEWQEHVGSASLQNNPEAISNAGQLYLIDPMGAIFMTYPGQSDAQAAIKQGKGMLKDLQRVLKLSKVG